MPDPNHVDEFLNTLIDTLEITRDALCALTVRLDRLESTVVKIEAALLKSAVFYFKNEVN